MHRCYQYNVEKSFYLLIPGELFYIMLFVLFLALSSKLYLERMLIRDLKEFLSSSIKFYEEYQEIQLVSLTNQNKLRTEALTLCYYLLH